VVKQVSGFGVQLGGENPPSLAHVGKLVSEKVISWGVPESLWMVAVLKKKEFEGSCTKFLMPPAERRKLKDWECVRLGIKRKNATVTMIRRRQ
jgi:hypothetical protein